MTKNLPPKAPSQFYRRVFQKSPEVQSDIQKTSDEVLSAALHTTDKNLLHAEQSGASKHRDVYFPLLIKVYSLQEKIRNLTSMSTDIFLGNKTNPIEIKQELHSIIKKMEEAQRWNQAVIDQANKGLDELQQSQSPSQKNLMGWLHSVWKRLIQW